MRGTPRGPETKLEDDLISRNWASQIWSKMLKFWRVGHADFDQIWIILMYHILSLLVLHVGAGSTCEMQYVCISETGIYLWYSYHLDVYVCIVIQMHEYLGFIHWGTKQWYRVHLLLQKHTVAYRSICHIDRYVTICLCNNKCPLWYLSRYTESDALLSVWAPKWHIPMVFFSIGL